MTIPVANRNDPFTLREGDTSYSLVIAEPVTLTGVTGPALRLRDRVSLDFVDGFDGQDMTVGAATVNGLSVTTFTFAFQGVGLPRGAYEAWAEFTDAAGNQGSTQTFWVDVEE